MPYRVSKSGGVYKVKKSGRRNGRSRRKTYGSKASAKRHARRRR